MLTIEQTHEVAKELCSSFFQKPVSEFAVWSETMEVGDESFIRLLFSHNREQLYMSRFYESTNLESMLGFLAMLTVYSDRTTTLFTADKGALLGLVVDDMKKASDLVKTLLDKPMADQDGVMREALDAMLDMAYTLVEAQKAVDDAVGRT